jgi:hypothetical protein
MTKSFDRKRKGGWVIMRFLLDDDEAETVELAIERALQNDAARPDSSNPRGKALTAMSQEYLGNGANRE